MEQSITSRVSGFADILIISGKDPKEFDLRPGELPHQLASRKIELVAEVYNEGTVLNAGDTDQWKYYPWHRIVKDASKPSGFGLSYYDYCDRWISGSSVGVRHCFKSEELAIDAGKKFIAEYEDMKIR